MMVLEPTEAYRIWAPTYAEETVISTLDEALASELSPPLEGQRLLDAGCGTGRRLAPQNAASAVGVDLCFEMLAAAMANRVALADVSALPFPDQAFDVVWCRLVLGHLVDPQPAYGELARVCRIGGKVLVSDFHAEAVARGHRRSFRDRTGREYEVVHHARDAASHNRMGVAAGLTLKTERDGVIGPSVESIYARAARLAAYEKDRGLPVVAALLFERTC